MSVQSQFTPTDTKLYFSKNDSLDPRLGDCLASSSPDITLWGYPDDEGIRLNNGRPGASEAPDKIREFFYKMTPHLNTSRLPKIQDLGNLNTNIDLEERHHAGVLMAKNALKHSRILALGGGHDYGYCESTAFAELYPDDVVILNLDAHLDVRPTDKGFNSGTPFRRLLQENSEHIVFVEAGIQPQCNSIEHLKWAKSKSALVLQLDQMGPQWIELKNLLTPFKNKKLFLSLDIDAFNSMEAPGCSQSWTTGLKTEDLLTFLNWLHIHFDFKGLGIYEVSPRLDTDNQTSKLAALIAHRFLHINLV